MIRLGWQSAKTPQPVADALRTLAQEYPLLENQAGDLSVSFEPISGAAERTFTLTKSGSGVVVRYSDLTAALRAVGTLMGGVENASESTTFTMFGIMLDCSRNAVMTVDHFKGWLRKLALMGYNMAMLYTEDTYELPDEPYFGYLRGAYTADELREIDRYAETLGIEMIPCIQTLGHMADLLKWDNYKEVKDTSSVLLVDEPKTYALIEKMIRHWSETFKTRRIHIGMDEAWDLGRGKFLDRNGYQDEFDIFNRHLGRIVELCKKYNLEPMIWSDMYFYIGSKERLVYDTKAVVPPEVQAKIPKDVQLVYWDYYHDTEEYYLDWIDRHRKLGSEPIVASGVWSWLLLWYGRELTEKNAGPCIQASKKAGVKELIFTLWADNGGYCEFDSALAGLAWSAEAAYTPKVVEDDLVRRFEAICHSDYREILLASDLHVPDTPCYVHLSIWDDPLLGIFRHNEQLNDPTFWPRIRDHYAALADKLSRCKTTSTDAGDLRHAMLLARFLQRKIDLRIHLEEAYARRDRDELQAVRKEAIEAADLVDRLDQSFRSQWLRRNKAFGLEVQQIRLAGLRRRYMEIDQRVGELLDGKIKQIDELENKVDVPLWNIKGSYKDLATSSSIL